MSLTISKVASEAGVNVQTLRYYERRGILGEPERSAAGYRQYEPDAVTRIRFIKRAQNLGFTLEEVQELLDLRIEHGAACSTVEEKARAKLTHVEEKLSELRRMRKVLQGLVGACERREPTEDCPILQTLDRN
ncbi:MAG: MerR family transcriptional regulator [Gemmatimonadota bacterium]